MLNRAKELKRFTIDATDGEIGQAIDFYFDEDRWTVRYIVVDAGAWFGMDVTHVRLQGVGRGGAHARNIARNRRARAIPVAQVLSRGGVFAASHAP